MFLLLVYLFFMKIFGFRKYMYKFVNLVENVCWLDGYIDFIFVNYFVFLILLGEVGSDCLLCIVFFSWFFVCIVIVFVIWYRYVFSVYKFVNKKILN